MDQKSFVFYPIQWLHREENRQVERRRRRKRKQQDGGSHGSSVRSSSVQRWGSRRRHRAVRIRIATNPGKLASKYK
jgi:hypothetical protein